MIARYRAWHRELGRMMLLKNMWFQDGFVEELELNDTVMNDYITAYPDEIELMQSTSLRDMNNREIFEGDIISDGHTSRDIRHHQALGFYTIDDNGVEEFFGDTASLEDFEEVSKYMSENIEIIGNIYENKELLDA